MRLAEATREQLVAIYSESHGLWGVGLSLADYQTVWEDVSRTAWARGHARFCVWLDDRERVCSSLKVYRPLVRVADRVCRATVLGAIFTPRTHRRQGHASGLVRAALDEGRRRGDGVALLFSDIGTRYYEAFGFQALPAQEHWGPLPRKSPARLEDWLLRPLLDSDMDAVRSAHDDTIARRPIAILRDLDHWEFLRVRSASYFQHLDDPRVRQLSLVANHHGRFAGFLTTVEGRGEWNVREIGASGGDPQLMATILALGAAVARQSGQRRYYGWLPPDVAERMPEWKMHTAERRRAVPMILPLDDGLDIGALVSLQTGFIPYQDQF